MNRAAALKAVDEYFGERLQSMCKILADAFEGSRDDRDKAKDRFINGLDPFLSAKAFAIETVTNKFPE